MLITTPGRCLEFIELLALFNSFHHLSVLQLQNTVLLPFLLLLLKHSHEAKEVET